MDTVETVLRPACLLAQQVLPAFERDVIFADDQGNSEEEGGASDLIAQLMELLQAMFRCLAVLLSRWLAVSLSRCLTVSLSLYLVALFHFGLS